MGRRGPPAMPPELKLLQGNRGHRPVDLTSVFRPETGAPSVPRELSREARKAWKRLVPELLRYNLLAKVHIDALEELCETIGMIKILRRSIIDFGDRALPRALRRQGADQARRAARKQP